jgi:hypothetical protein
MRRMLKIVQSLCGFFELYVAIGCVIGFALPPSDPQVRRCLPQESGFGVLEAKCASVAADLFWSVIVSWPRVEIIGPAGIVAEIKATVRNDVRDPSIADAVPFDPWSLPFALVLCVSFVYWEARSKLLAIGLTATLLGEILYLGWTG